jgi:predicted TIM-barrel fold metal-dependent hydrolase
LELWAPNCAAWITAALGVLAAGAWPVTLDTRLKGEEEHLKAPRGRRSWTSSRSTPPASCSRTKLRERLREEANESGIRWALPRVSRMGDHLRSRVACRQIDGSRNPVRQLAPLAPREERNSMAREHQRPPTMSGCYDSDQHAVELRDQLPHYMEPAFRERGWRLVKAEDGRAALAVGDEVSRLSFDEQPVPGSFRENILRSRAGEDLDPFQGTVGPVLPEFVDRDRRLEFMDQQGIEGTLIFPGAALEGHWLVEEDDTAQLYANLRAVNRLSAERWGWCYRNRIFAGALMSLQDLDLALEELDRLMVDGCKLVNLIPGPVQGRSPADPCFDPFWARINESRMLVSLHTAPASHTAYRKMLDGFWEPMSPPSIDRGLCDTTSAFMGFQMFNERPIMDTVAALILHNLFGRFPDVRVISVENGAFWVTYAVKLMNKNYAINQNGYWLGGKPERPSSVFRKHISVTPFHEDDVRQLVGVVGADAVTFGSDYPHAEGLASPVREFLEDLNITEPESVEKVMRTNLKSLLERVGT